MKNLKSQIKKTILSLLLIFLLSYCGDNTNRCLEIINNTMLELPKQLKSCDFIITRNPDYWFPYVIRCRVKMTKKEYITMVNKSNMFNALNHFKLEGRKIKNPFLWSMEYGEYDIPDWWLVSYKCDSSFLYANYFFDNGKKKEIGDKFNFNGKISTYFDNAYCYILIVCFPPKI